MLYLQRIVRKAHSFRCGMDNSKGENEMNHTIACGDTLELIKQVPHQLIDLLVTSPPVLGKACIQWRGRNRLRGHT